MPKNPQFDVPLGVPTADAVAVFANLEFQKVNTREEDAIVLTEHDKDWIEQTKSEGKKVTPPPSYAAQRYLEKHLGQYNFDLPVTQTQWQNFVLTKLFEQANDLDPKISKPALDTLAKTSAVGLMDQKVDVSITHKSSEELESALKKALERYTGMKTIEGVAERVP